MISQCFILSKFILRYFIKWVVVVSSVYLKYFSLIDIANWFQTSTFAIFLQIRINEASAPMEVRAAVKYRGGDLSYLEPGSRSCGGHAESPCGKFVRIGIARGSLQRWSWTLGRPGIDLWLLRGFYGYYERKFRSQESQEIGNELVDL